MADLGNYNDKLLQDEEQQQGAGLTNTANPVAGTSGVVSGTQGSGVSTAGVGSGGTGGWTNIQAYLNANKSDNGSSNLLSDKAGGQYDKEIGNLNTQAGEAKTQAQSEANKIKDANDNSKTWVNQAANAYSWSGPQSQNYKDSIGKVQGALTGQYQGPNNFAYTQSGDFQKSGAALKDDPSFSNYMNDIYKEKAGGQLTSGQGALQTQLDVNNQGLADARKALLEKYAGFQGLSDAAVADTDAAINKARTDYGNNQEALRFNLQNMANDYDTQIGQAEADARAGYNTAYSTDKNTPWLVSQTRNGTGDVTGEQWETRTIKDLVDAKNANQKYWNQHLQTNDPLFRGYEDAINNFYSTQDSKYANTGDEQERNWNAIMDILGNTANRKEQGFKVRG